MLTGPIDATRHDPERNGLTAGRTIDVIEINVGVRGRWCWRGQRELDADMELREPQRRERCGSAIRWARPARAW